METRDPGHEYIEQMRAEGYTDLDIRDALSDAGWTDDQIRRAMAPDEECPPPPPPRERDRERHPQRAAGGSSTTVWIMVMLGCLGMVVLVGAVIAAILFPVFARSREQARQTSCLSNLKQIGLAHMMYAQDYGETLTPAPGWPERLFPYINNTQVFNCPGVEDANAPLWRGSPVEYTMNSAIGGVLLRNIASPAQVPIDYDGSTLVGGQNDVALRHNDGANCGFVDGHAKWVYGGSWNAHWTAPVTGSPGSPSAPPPPPSAPPPPMQPDTTSEAPLTRSPHQEAPAAACQSNLKQLSVGMLMYVADYDGVAPASQGWPEALYPYLPNERLLVCPSDPQPHESPLERWQISYTLNDELSRRIVRGRPEPARTIMLFDGSALGGEAEAAEFRHVGGLNTSYLDGHVSRVEQEQWQTTWGQQPAE